MASVLLTGMATLDFVFQIEKLPTEALKYRADDFEMVGGGCAANAAVAVARLGGRAVLVTRLGDDRVGEDVLADLRAEGVDCDRAVVTPGARSSMSSVTVDAAGERQIVNFRGRDLTTDPGSLDAVAPEAGAVLVDARWPEAARAALKLAKARGIPGIIDAEPLMPDGLADLATHVALSLQGLRDLTGIEDKREALLAADARFSGWVCVTDGADGTSFVSSGEIIDVPSFDVVAVDTLGAGDVWHGAFALRLAEGATEHDAVRFANGVAALKCTGFGGRRATPDRQSTDTFLMERA